MSAILELKETPESCYGRTKKCPLSADYWNQGIIRCQFVNDDIVEEYQLSRHPDCPLKIVEELRWVRNGFNLFSCPKCGRNYHASYVGRHNDCDCGIRLLPPIDK